MTRSLLTAVALVTALLVPVASATAQGPAPAETAQQYVERWRAAIEAADCATLSEIYGFPATGPACAQQADLLKGIEVVGVQQFGPAAVVRFRGPKVAEGETVVAAWRGARGRFIDNLGFLGLVSFRLPSTIGTPAAARARFDRAATAYLRALRTRDCDALYRLETTPPRTSKRAQCRDAFASRLARGVTRRTRAQRIGGNRRWSFHSVRVGSQVHTLTLFIDADGGIDVLTSTQLR